MKPSEKLELAMKLIGGKVFGPAKIGNPVGMSGATVQAQTRDDAEVYVAYTVLVPMNKRPNPLQPQLVGEAYRVSRAELEEQTGIPEFIPHQASGAEVAEEITKPETPEAIAETRKKCACSPGHYCMRCV